MAMKFRSRKGILLTLLVIVLFILMLGEVMTYIMLSINYSQLASSSSGAFNQGAAVGLISTSATSFIHQSLSSALSTLIRYEGNPGLRGTKFVNNTQYALISLMTNSTLYGNSMSIYMGASNMSTFVNSIITSANLQGINLSIKNSSITVFQGSPATINATYSAWALARTSYGVFTFPIYATTGINLNGTYDLQSLAKANPAAISFQSQYPTATLIGNSLATTGSRSPFLFTYGTLIVIGSVGTNPTCSSVPTRYQNDRNLILAVYNAISITQNSCGMGGLITIVPNSLTPNTPYLVYPPSSNIFNAIQNNTAALLSGNGLALLNISALQNAVQNINYYQSSYVPTYLDQGSGAFSQRPATGLFSFNILNRLAPFFNNPSTTGSSNILIPLSKGLTLKGPFSVSLWFQSSVGQVPFGGGYIGALLNTSQPNGFGYSLVACGSKAQAPCTGGFGVVSNIGNGVAWLNQNAGYNFNITQNTWYNVVATYTTNSWRMYVNGVSVANGIFTTSGTGNFADGSHSLTIGGCQQPTGAVPCFSGKIANIQLYNAILYPQEVANLYYGGIGSPPVHANSLVAWWPLNGNVTDFAYNGFSGTSTLIRWTSLNNYLSDPVYQNTPYSFSINATAEGVINCSNLNNCGDTTLPHLFLTNLPMTSNNGVPISEATAFGLSNAVIPTALSFSNNGYAIQKNSLKWLGAPANPFSLSIWVSPLSTNGQIISLYNNSAAHTGMLSISNGILFASLPQAAGPAISCLPLGALVTNTWTQITLTYAGNTVTTFNGYVNGVFRATNSVTRTAAGGLPALFSPLGILESKSCPGAATVPAYNGSMADFQIYNVLLTAPQVMQLYLNNSVVGITANAIYPLSMPANGVYNQTLQTATAGTLANYMYFTTCTNANALNGQCGLKYIST